MQIQLMTTVNRN